MTVPRGTSPPVMKDVFSSHVQKIGHDPETGDLHVLWDTGKTSIYSGVPDGVAKTVMSSWSVGKALKQHVKDAYPHRYSE